MRLTRIAARDFMGFAELDRDLTTSHSIVVVGKNGHGKSTLYDIARYALYGKGRFKAGLHGGNPDQQVRHGTERLWVCIEFDTPDGRHVRVERSKAVGKTASVGVWIDGEDATTISGRRHTNAETNALIESLIGMPYDMLTAGPWMEQEHASALMTADPADRLRMFVKLFDAEWCAPLYDEAKRLRDEHDRARAAAALRVDEMDRTIARRPEIDESLRTNRERHARLQERQSIAAEQLTQVREKVAAIAERKRHADGLLDKERRLDSAIEAAERDVARLSAIVERAADALAQPMPEMVVPADPPSLDDVAAAEREVSVGHEARTRAATLRSQARGQQEKVTELEADRGILGQVPCGGVGEFATCQFLTRVPEQSAIDAMKAAITDAISHAGREDAVAAAGERRATDLDGMRRLRDEHSRLTHERQVIAERYASARSAAERAQAEHGVTIANLRDRIAADTAERDAALAERRSIDPASIDGGALADERAQIESMAANIRRQSAEAEAEVRRAEALDAVVKQAEADVVMWRATLARESTDTDTYAVLAKAFHPTGIPTLIVENGIGAIEERVNELLGHLPDDFRIEMRTQRETKSGGLADALDIVVTTKGYETPYEFLSVGQRFRVDLALRVGLSEVLAMRRGTRIETLWLDEPFADLDEEGREAVASALAALTADFDLVVVVSHHPEFNEMFDGMLRVEQDDDGVSRITEAAA